MTTVQETPIHAPSLHKPRELDSSNLQIPFPTEPFYGDAYVMLPLPDTEHTLRCKGQSIDPSTLPESIQLPATFGASGTQHQYHNVVRIKPSVIESIQDNGRRIGGSGSNAGASERRDEETARGETDVKLVLPTLPMWTNVGGSSNINSAAVPAGLSGWSRDRMGYLTDAEHSWCQTHVCGLKTILRLHNQCAKFVPAMVHAQKILFVNHLQHTLRVLDLFARGEYHIPLPVYVAYYKSCEWRLGPRELITPTTSLSSSSLLSSAAPSVVSATSTDVATKLASRSPLSSAIENTPLYYLKQWLLQVTGIIPIEILGKDNEERDDNKHKPYETRDAYRQAKNTMRSLLSLDISTRKTSRLFGLFVQHIQCWRMACDHGRVVDAEYALYNVLLRHWYLDQFHKPHNVFTSEQPRLKT